MEDAHNLSEVSDQHLFCWYVLECTVYLIDCRGLTLIRKVSTVCVLEIFYHFFCRVQPPKAVVT